MAELNTGDSGTGKHQKQRAKKMSTKMDMTPMVDLAFLLLTFFMLATTFNSLKVMELNTTADGPPTKVKNAITVLLDNNGNVYWYNGELNPGTKLEKTSCSKQGLRRLLLDRNSGNFTVVVKPSAKTNYERVIDVLDELKIANVQRYALVDPQQQELALLSGN